MSSVEWSYIKEEIPQFVIRGKPASNGDVIGKLASAEVTSHLFEHTQKWLKSVRLSQDPVPNAGSCAQGNEHSCLTHPQDGTAAGVYLTTLVAKQYSTSFKGKLLVSTEFL
jgi:hypothetical protein